MALVYKLLLCKHFFSALGSFSRPQQTDAASSFQSEDRERVLRKKCVRYPDARPAHFVRILDGENF
jgi:hypothetical protein